MFVMAVIASVSLAQEPVTMSPPAPPAPPKVEPQVKFSGVIFPRFGLDLTEGKDDFNAFEVDRTYLKADVKITDKLASRFTIDSGRVPAPTVTLPDGTAVTGTGDTQLRVFVKHAWFEYKPSDAITTRGGLTETPFLPFEEKFEGTRYAAKAFLDDLKLEATADLGASVGGKHADGLVTWMVGAYNGETFKAPEVDAGKSFQALVVVDPLAAPDAKTSLPIAVFVDESLHTGGDPRTTFAGFVGFKAPELLVTAQFDGTMSGGTTGLGQSVLAQVRAPDVAFVLGRFDHWDPSSAADDGQIKIIGGVGKDFMKNVSAIASYERTMSEVPDSTPVHGVFLRGQVGF
jgi:hypothetical protein